MNKLSKAVCIAAIFLPYRVTSAIDNTSQAIVVVSAANLMNTASAVYMQQHGMNPQLVSNPNGATTVVSSTPSSANGYIEQNQQDNKQAFFSGS